MLSISISVGQGGQNRRPDVITVQELLKRAGAYTGRVDGICGPRTIAAILAFQKSFLSHPDGLIEPNRTTWQKLVGVPVNPQPSRTDGPTGWDGDSSKWPQEKKLASLNTRFRPLVEILLLRLTQRGLQPKVFYAWRSIDVQRDLLRKGKTTVSFSFHNAQHVGGAPNAYAADIIDKRYGWDDRPETKEFWKALGEEAKRLGLIWGGDWKSFPDEAHVQLLLNSELARIKKESGL